MAEGDTGTTTATTTTTTAAPWFQGKVEADVIQHWQSKGYDVNDPAKVATELTKAYRSAEGLLGLPADRLIKLPADMAKEPDAMKAIFQRLGAPLDAKDYDFPALKGQDGKYTDEAFADAFRNAAAAAHLPKEAAAKIAEAVVKFAGQQDEAEVAEKTANLKTEREALAKNWGGNHAQNLVIAQNAAAALKVTPQDLQALEGVAGYARVMEMFREIGTKIGEARFVTGGTQGTAVMTVAEAEAKVKELKGDKDFAKRYNNGETAAKKQMTDLLKIIVGDEMLNL